MPTVAYAVVADPHDRAWIESTLAPSVGLVFVDDGPNLLARMPRGPGHCLIVSCDQDGAAALRLVRDLRNSGSTLPVIALGAHTAFRTAVALARLGATDFLERPVSVRQLRAAVRRAGAPE
ncbi:MAG: response regulator [Variovorax sp.]|nr:MAG: response regulator [Variovorax sp.]